MKHSSLFGIALFFAAAAAWPQSPPPAPPPAAAAPAAALPLKRVALFSSGVGYFEHGGNVSGAAAISFSFDLEAVNDALKSLAVNDPAPEASPSVSYPSEETLFKTLQSLGIDLSGNPGTAEIFAAQRGAEIEVAAPTPVSGRIIGVEYRNVPAAAGAAANTREAYLSLFTDSGFRIIAFKDIGSFSFKDAALNADLKRALDLIAANRASRTRNLLVTLNAANPGTRNVSLSYVIPAPVWKVSYRLDLGQAHPLLQGWAIVDNGSDNDWNNVELSLVSGRPVSFVQDLYPPYYLARPVLPLAIAGTAQARSYDSGYGRERKDKAGIPEEPQADYFAEELEAPGIMMNKAPAVPRPVPAGAVMAAAQGAAAGDQFAFTVSKPVTLFRRQSAMLPLVNGNVIAVKSLTLSGARALGGTIHPELAAEITNTTGMKLPAGPITVYDGGTYAGDALIEFFSENDKRFIGYGEDLSVTAQAKAATSRIISTVTIAGGVMTISRRLVYERTYTVKNASSEAKRLVVEHPITAGASLSEPAAFLEQTASAYRFLQNLPASGETTLTVREESPLSERVVLAQLRPESLVSYSTNQEMPQAVRDALAKAVELQRKAEAARQVLADRQTQKTRLVSEQERVRQNLAAAGNDTDLGRNYLKRMTSLDSDIDRVNSETEAAEKLAQSSREDLDRYIAGLKL
jgi:hypothetical protein